MRKTVNPIVLAHTRFGFLFQRGRNPHCRCVPCRNLRLLLSGVLIFIEFYVATPASAAEFLRLGDLNGGMVESSATGISSDGDIIVGFSSSTPSGFGFEAYRWTEESGLLGLGSLPGGLAFFSSSWAVSADGMVVVGNSISERSGTAIEAFRWTPEGGMVGLGGIIETGGFVYSMATDISGDGQVIVGGGVARRVGLSDEFEAFRWTEVGGMRALGDLPGGEVGSAARAISADGLVIVGSSESDRGTEAFRWTKHSGMVGLGGLGQERFRSFARDVSADGNVVVGVSNTDEMGPRAFRWTKHTGMVAIDETPFRISYATGVSADGGVIVGAATVDDVDSAFIWTEDDGMLILQDWLVAEYGLGAELAGWTLTKANAVSADGRAIVGEGTNPTGNREGWLVRLDPVPEPATAATAILAACSALIAFRRIGRK